MTAFIYVHSSRKFYQQVTAAAKSVYSYFSGSSGAQNLLLYLAHIDKCVFHFFYSVPYKVCGQSLSNRKNLVSK